MTLEQWEMVSLLAQCRFAPATWDKRFVRDMHARGKDASLSEKQAEQINRLFHRYRKQIAAIKKDHPTPTARGLE